MSYRFKTILNINNKINAEKKKRKNKRIQKGQTKINTNKHTQITKHNIFDLSPNTDTPRLNESGIIKNIDDKFKRKKLKAHINIQHTTYNIQHKT